MKKYIVLFGKKRVGKSESAKYIKQYIDGIGMKLWRFYAKIDNFAYSIKKFREEVLGVPIRADKESLTQYKWENLDNRLESLRKNKDGSSKFGQLSVRDIDKTIGDLGRMFYRDIWADSFFRRNYSEGCFDDVYVVGDDGRFLSELAKCKENNALLIRLKRNTGLIDNHQSEIELDDIPDSVFNYVIDNNGSIEELYEALHDILVKEIK